MRATESLERDEVHSRCGHVDCQQRGAGTFPIVRKLTIQAWHMLAELGYNYRGVCKLHAEIADDLLKDVGE